MVPSLDLGRSLGGWYLRWDLAVWRCDLILTEVKVCLLESEPLCVTP
jgi:hypothetical protein